MEDHKGKANLHEKCETVDLMTRELLDLNHCMASYLMLASLFSISRPKADYSMITGNLSELPLPDFNDGLD